MSFKSLYYNSQDKWFPVIRPVQTCKTIMENKIILTLFCQQTDGRFHTTSLVKVMVSSAFNICRNLAELDVTVIIFHLFLCRMYDTFLSKHCRREVTSHNLPLAWPESMFCSYWYKRHNLWKQNTGTQQRAGAALFQAKIKLCLTGRNPVYHESGRCKCRTFWMVLSYIASLTKAWAH